MTTAWPSQRLKHVADIGFSTVDKKSVDGEISVKLCNYTDVYYNDQIGPDLSFMEATASPDEVRAFGLRSGDVLITKDSETADDIGVPAFVPTALDGVVCGYHLAVLRPKRGEVHPKFLFWVLASQYLGQQMEVVASGVTRYGLRFGDVGNLRLYLPDLSEQRAKADLLDRETARIDTMIGSSERLLSLLNERRRTTVFAEVTGANPVSKTHDPGLPWAERIRYPWHAVPIKHVARLGSGHTPSRAHPEWWEDAAIRWVTTGEIHQIRSDRVEVITETRESISEIGLANSAAELHPKGTVVLCRTASAGYSAIMGSDMATSQDFATWTCTDRLLPRYLLMCLRAMRADLLGRLAFGSTHRTIYMPDIAALKIPLPSVVEQRQVLEAIDARIQPIDALADRVMDRIGRLRERRQALITAAVTGEIDARF